MIQNEYDTKLKSKGKIGRPTISEQKGDPDLPEKAMILRLRGLSWSQVAKELDVGRTTARRLCEKGSKEQKDPQSEKTSENKDIEDDFFVEDEIFEQLPLLYQKFIRLMREVRDENM